MTTTAVENKVLVDVSHLVGGATVANHWLIAKVAAATNVDMDDVVAELRGFIDSHAGPGSDPN